MGQLSSGKAISKVGRLAAEGFPAAEGKSFKPDESRQHLTVETITGKTYGKRCVVSPHSCEVGTMTNCHLEVRKLRHRGIK